MPCWRPRWRGKKDWPCFSSSCPCCCYRGSAGCTRPVLMSQLQQPYPEDSTLVGRLLARLDRVQGLGGGRTHFVFLGLFFGFCLSLYLTVLKVRGPASTIKTWIEWDRAFPFTPWWTWVYLLPYIIGPLLVGVIRRPVFTWFVRRALVVAVVSLVI